MLQDLKLAQALGEKIVQILHSGVVLKSVEEA
jgi:hypothetical protein